MASPVSEIVQSYKLVGGPIYVGLVHNGPFFSAMVHCMSHAPSQPQPQCRTSPWMPVDLHLTSIASYHYSRIHRAFDAADCEDLTHLSYVCLSYGKMLAGKVHM